MERLNCPYFKQGNRLGHGYIGIFYFEVFQQRSEWVVYSLEQRVQLTIVVEEVEQGVILTTEADVLAEAGEVTVSFFFPLALPLTFLGGSFPPRPSPDPGDGESM